MADYGAQIAQTGRITCPSNAAYDFGTGDFTLTMLVRTSGPGCVLNRQANANSAGFSVVIQDGGVIEFITSNDQGFYKTFTDDTDVADGYWHHIAAVRQSGQLTIYLDGTPVQVGVGGGQPTPVDVSNSLALIMGDDPAGDAPFSGLLEDVTVWNRALNETQLIPTRYNQITGDEPGLVGFWAMDDNLDDGSPTGNNGVGTDVTFVQIFHCDSASGDYDYAFASVTNDGTKNVESLAARAATEVTRHVEFEVEAGAPAMMATLITSVDDFTFPAGATLSITDPSGKKYDKAQNDDDAFVQMEGDSVKYFAILSPKVGKWIVEVTAPGSTTLNAVVQTVPSASIPDTLEDVLEPIYGESNIPAGTTLAEAETSVWGWVAMGVLTAGLGLLTVATLGATAPVVLGTLAVVGATEVAIVASAVSQLPSDKSPDFYVNVGANLAQVGTDKNTIITADVNNDDATKPLYQGRVEFYGYLVSTSSFERVRLNKSRFVADNINTQLQKPSVKFFTSSSHGQPSYLVGYDQKDVLRVNSYPAAAARGKVFHLLACKAGAGLGKDLVTNGATAVFGYNAAFQLLTGQKYAFVHCDSVIDYQLVQGKTAGAAQDAARAEFEAQIKRFNDSGNHYAAQVLTADLEILVGPRDAGYGDPNAVIT